MYSRCSIIYDGSEPILFVLDPDLIKRITISDAHHFEDLGLMHDLAASLEVNDLGLMNTTGDRWKRLKAAMSPAFTLKNIRTMTSAVDEVRMQL